MKAFEVDFIDKIQLSINLPKNFYISTERLDTKKFDIVTSDQQTYNITKDDNKVGDITFVSYTKYMIDSMDI